MTIRVTKTKRGTRIRATGSDANALFAAMTRNQQPETVQTMKYTHAEWQDEGIKRFGPDRLKWKFKCPSCGHVAAVSDWQSAGAPTGAVAFSCIGRYTGSKKEMGDKTGGPCNYTTGGLFNISPVEVLIDFKTTSVFDFAPADLPESTQPGTPGNVGGFEACAPSTQRHHATFRGVAFDVAADGFGKITTEDIGVAKEREPGTTG